MAELSRFEKSVVALILVVGLLGGVILVYLKMPAIVASVFFGIAIATLVYHFLGGIDDASFDLGPIKLGGSIAALIASAWIINGQLSSQSINTDQQLFLGRDYTVLTEDSTRLGMFKLDNITLTKTLNVITPDSLVLGNIHANNLSQLQFFNELNLSNYIELRYNIQLNPKFEAERNFNAFAKFSEDYRFAYGTLPFTVRPIYTTGNQEFEQGIYTSISYKNLDRPNTLRSIGSGWSEIISGVDNHIYIVRLRASNISDSTKDYFANYQILKFAPALEN